MVKDLAFQVNAPALEVGIGFRLLDWLVSGILTSVLLGVGGLPLVPVSQFLLFITLRWTG